MRLFRAAANEHGTSLVEILVVMVVLLVGIMSVVRLFPGGFFAVRHAENVTLANRLSQAELERLKGLEENLPAGIVPVDASGVVLNDQEPGPRFSDGTDSVAGDNINTFRRVLGEVTKVPVGTYYDAGVATDYGSVYNTIFSPIAQKSITIYGGSLRRRLVDTNDDDPYSLRPFQYGIDYDSASGDTFKIGFMPVNYARTFRIAFSWWELNGTSREMKSTVVTQDVAAGFDQWIPITIPVTGTLIGLEEYSDTAARAFNEVSILAQWNQNDYYQYKVISYDTGTIAFNPYGYNANERTVDGIKILEAHIDYDIYDLKIVHEDKVVPNDADNNYQVKLALKYIKQMGQTTELNGSTYTGFALPTGGDPADLVILDKATGFRVQYPGGGVDVDYKNGTIEFPQNSTVTLTNPATGATINQDMAGRSIRVYYEADGDWRVIVHKAYELYHRINTGTNKSDFQSFDVNGSLPSRLNFALCDVGKSVAVDYYYADANGGQRVVGEVHEIQKGTGKGYIDLSHTPTRITAVYGTSIKVRVIWAEGANRRRLSNGNYDWLPKFHWVDTDSTLTRKAFEE